MKIHWWVISNPKPNLLSHKDMQMMKQILFFFVIKKSSLPLPFPLLPRWYISVCTNLDIVHKMGLGWSSSSFLSSRKKKQVCVCGWFGALSGRTQEREQEGMGEPSHCPAYLTPGKVREKEEMISFRLMRNTEDKVSHWGASLMDRKNGLEVFTSGVNPKALLLEIQSSPFHNKFSSVTTTPVWSSLFWPNSGHSLSQSLQQLLANYRIMSSMYWRLLKPWHGICLHCLLFRPPSGSCYPARELYTIPQVPVQMCLWVCVPAGPVPLPSPLPLKMLLIFLPPHRLLWSIFLEPSIQHS